MKLYFAIVLMLISGCSAMQTQPPAEPLPQPAIYNVTRTNVYMPPRPQGIGVLQVKFDVITTTPCVATYGTRRDGTLITIANLTEADRLLDFNNQPLAEPLSVSAWLARGPTKDSAGNIIQTCGNIHNKLIEIRKKYGYEPSMIVMSPQSYENMSINTANSTRYIQEIINILEYYEGVISDLNDQDIITDTTK